MIPSPWTRMRMIFRGCYWKQPLPRSCSSGSTGTGDTENIYGGDGGKSEGCWVEGGVEKKEGYPPRVRRIF